MGSMDIRTESDITPDVAKQIRSQSGLTQKQFWESVGSNQGSGHWFEAGKRRGIPKPIRILIFLKYVANVDIDVTTPESAQVAVKIGREVAARIEAQRAEDEAKQAQQRAREMAEKVRQVAEGGTGHWRAQRT